jgi:hypothetical protein
MGGSILHALIQDKPAVRGRQFPSIRRADRTYTLENIGRSLQPEETLLDVAYEATEERKTRKAIFHKIHFKIKYETLQDRSKNKGKMPDNIGNDWDVQKFNSFAASRVQLFSWMVMANNSAFDVRFHLTW